MKHFLLTALALLLFTPLTSSADVSAGEWAKSFDVDGVGVNPCGTLEKGRLCYLVFGTSSYTPTSQVSANIQINSESAVLCLDGNIAATTAGGSVAGIYKYVGGTSVSTNGFVLLPTSGLPTAGGDPCYTLVPGLYNVSVTTSGSLQSALSLQGF